jgi:septal ring factor EnvC (AmiA/AmiB activator)
MTSLRAALAVLALVAPLAAGAATDAARLDKLRAQLDALAEHQASDVERRDALTRELRTSERLVAAADAARREAEAALATEQRALAGLQRERGAAEAALARERGLLAAQVRAAYVAGREERLKLLLNQQDPSRVGRTLVYYDRFNEARSARIEEVDAARAALADLERQIEAKVAVLAGVRKARAAALADLTRTRDARRAVVARLEADLKARGAKVTRLEREAGQLKRLLESIGDVFADSPDEVQRPFAKQRGRLPWPLKGRVLRRFGEARAEGRLRWDGWLIETPSGSEVRSVAGGRVAFADWLPHYGMLAIVDHGDGYLSLYGHNQALYKQHGEWVQRGEVLALSGDTGGQDRAALYFEVRQGKQPVDPRLWLAKR